MAMSKLFHKSYSREDGVPDDGSTDSMALKKWLSRSITHSYFPAIATLQVFTGGPRALKVHARCSSSSLFAARALTWTKSRNRNDRGHCRRRNWFGGSSQMITAAPIPQSLPQTPRSESTFCDSLLYIERLTHRLSPLRECRNRSTRRWVAFWAVF